MSDKPAMPASAEPPAQVFRPTIRFSIFGGFLGLVLLMLGTSLYGFVTTQQTGVEVARIDRLGSIARLANDIARRIGDVRLAGVEMMENNAPDSADPVYGQFQALKRDVDEALLSLEGLDQYALLRNIATRLDDFGSGLQRLAALREQRTTARANFLAASETLQQAIDSRLIPDDIWPEGQSGTSLRDEMTATLRRATGSLLEDDMATATVEADALARQHIRVQSMATAAAPELAPTVRRAAAALAQVTSTLKDLVAIDIETGRLRITTLDQEGAQIGRLTSQLESSAGQAERNAVRRLELEMRNVERRNLGVALLCLAAAVGCAIAVSRATVGPLLSLTRRMSRLVRGDIASPIPYLDRRNEIGEMARATLAFQRSLHDQQIARAAAETALAERDRAEARYRTFFENAVVGIFQTTPDGRYLDANPALAAIMGYDSPADLMANVNDIASQVYVDPHVRYAYLQRLRRDGAVHNFEYRIRRRSGEIRWLSESTRALRTNGHIVELQGMLYDVTEQKRARAALAREQEVLRAILDTVEPGILVFDETLRLAVWNTQATVLLGLQADQLARMRPTPDELALLVAAWGGFGPLLADGDAAAFLRGLGRHPLMPERGGDFRFITHDGRLLDVSTAPLPTGGFLRTLIDVTERERVRAAVAESEHLLRTLIDAVPAMVQIKGPDLRYRLINRMVSEVFQVDPDLAIGMTTNEILARHGLSKSDEYDRYVLSTGQPIGFYEEELPEPSGRTRPWLTKKVPLLDEHGDISGIATVALDISERKRAERAMQEARDTAEEAARLKSEFLAMISHEIRTPMNGIIGMLEPLERTRLDADQRQTVGVIRDSATALLRIVNDVLDFSRIEAGRLDVVWADTPVLPLLESVVEVLSVLARDKDIALSAFVDPGVPAVIRSDPVRLRQILLNLVGNAVKFTQQGHVRVSASLDAEPALAARLRLTIADSGPGIAPTDLDRLFEPFAQAERDPAQRAAGTGLGLTIARRLAQLMDGDISVESRIGEGSVFTVDLPLHPVGTQANADMATRSLAGLRVLLGIGSAPERRAIAGYLEAAAATVTAVPDAAGAWAAAAAVRSFDVAVLEPIVLASGVGTAAAGDKVVCLAGWEADPDSTASATVIRPWRRDAILRAVAVASGRASPELATPMPAAEAALPVVASVADARAANRLILVVDDHPTNRNVLLRQLRLLGYTAEACDDGAAALAALARGGVGLILTDCHMPGMSGFTLTARIREQEATSGRRTPIIAVTANALRGEAERCLAAGMDGYLAKPIRLEELARTVGAWLPGTGSPRAAVIPAATPSVLDREVLGELFGEEPAEISRMLHDFRRQAANAAADIRDALAANSPAAGELAHRLKGVAHTIGAGEIGAAAAAIEAALHRHDPAGASDALPGLDAAIARFATLTDTQTETRS